MVAILLSFLVPELSPAKSHQFFPELDNLKSFSSVSGVIAIFLLILLVPLSESSNAGIIKNISHLFKGVYSGFNLIKIFQSNPSKKALTFLPKTLWL